MMWNQWLNKTQASQSCWMATSSRPLRPWQWHCFVAVQLPPPWTRALLCVGMKHVEIKIMTWYNIFILATFNNITQYYLFSLKSFRPFWLVYPLNMDLVLKNGPLKIVLNSTVASNMEMWCYIFTTSIIVSSLPTYVGTWFWHANQAGTVGGENCTWWFHDDPWG